MTYRLTGTSSTNASVIVTLGGFGLVCAKCGITCRRTIQGFCDGCAK